MKDTDRAYLAGIIDGEGSICLVRTKAGSQRPQLNVDSTDEELIDWIVDRFGGRKYVRNPATDRHKKGWRWRVENKNALSILKEIYDFLILERKKSRAKILIEEYPTKVSRNGYYTEDSLKVRDEMFNRFRSL